MKYQEHFLLDCDEVISYVKEKNLFSENANLTVKEIGDGNINYIFKILIVILMFLCAYFYYKNFNFKRT